MHCLESSSEGTYCFSELVRTCGWCLIVTLTGVKCAIEEASATQTYSISDEAQAERLALESLNVILHAYTQRRHEERNSSGEELPNWVNVSVGEQ